jgi:hypothetical protein
MLDETIRSRHSIYQLNGPIKEAACQAAVPPERLRQGVLNLERPRSETA